MTDVAAELASLVGADRVRADVAERRAKSRDCWPRLTLRDRAGEDMLLPLAVVRPESTDEVAAVYRWATATKVPVVPYGGGSGVVGGAAPVEGGICLDLTGLSGLVDLDEVSGTATFRAGTAGPDAERIANAHGRTLGHFPSSIMCSTVGGWVAARGAGQLSSRYGKAEDLCIAVECVLPTGEVWQTLAAPRTAAGPDMWRVLLGAEGTLGAITEVTLRTFPLPVIREFGGWLFPTMTAGLAALRDVMQSGARPAVLRLYDEVDTAIVLGGQGLPVTPGALLITMCEGDPHVVGAEVAVLRAACADASDEGTGPGEHWWAHRYDQSFLLPQVLDGRILGEHAIADTIEVAALWSRLPELYASMHSALSTHADAVLAHISHCYPEGASIYWSFAAAATDAESALTTYDAIWLAAMESCRAGGGTISHHHGAGLARAPWLAAEMGPGHAVLAAVKRAVDPAGIANPGKLGL